MMISVAALQFPLGGEITLEDRLHLIRHRPDFVCLPEYFFVRPSDQQYADGNDRIERQLAMLTHLSRELSCVVVGGTMAHPVDGGYANVASIFNRGEPIGSYQKVNPYGREEKRGIVAGTEFKIFDIDGVRVGVLICADALQAGSFARMAQMGADVIFVPTVSPYREYDTVFEKDSRDSGIFVTGAQKANAFVVKTCGIGTLFGGRLQGRSGIFAPWGILHRVPPNEEDRKQVLFEYLDIEEIREFKRMMAREALDKGRDPGVAEISQITAV
jgi:predicted amidohydrolase